MLYHYMKKMTKYLMEPHLITKIDYIMVITMPEIMKQEIYVKQLFIDLSMTMGFV